MPDDENILQLQQQQQQQEQERREEPFRNAMEEVQEFDEAIEVGEDEFEQLDRVQLNRELRGFEVLEIRQPEQVQENAPAPVLEAPVRQQAVNGKQRRTAQRQAARERRAEEKRLAQERRAEEKRLAQERKAEENRQKQERKREEWLQKQRDKAAAAWLKEQRQQQALRAKNQLLAEKILGDANDLLNKIGQEIGYRVPASEVRDPEQARVYGQLLEGLESVNPVCMGEISACQQAVLDYVEDRDIGMRLFRHFQGITPSAFQADEDFKQAYLQWWMVTKHFEHLGKRMPKGMEEYLNENYQAAMLQRGEILEHIAALKEEMRDHVTERELREASERDIQAARTMNDSYKWDGDRKELDMEQLLRDRRIAQRRYERGTAGQYRREKRRDDAIAARIDELKVLMSEGMTEEEKQAKPLEADYLEQCRDIYEHGNHHVISDFASLLESLPEYRAWIEKHVLDDSAARMLETLNRLEPQLQKQLPKFRDAIFYAQAVYGSLEKEVERPFEIHQSNGIVITVNHDPMRIRAAEEVRLDEAKRVIRETWEMRNELMRSFFGELGKQGDEISYTKPALMERLKLIKSAFSRVSSYSPYGNVMGPADLTKDRINGRQQ